MTEEEIYVFDLQGYIVVPEAITPQQCVALNEMIDARGIPSLLEETNYIHTGFPDDEFNAGNHDPDAGPVDVPLGLLFDWGPAVRALVDNPVINPYLETMLGPQFRLDHAYAIFMAGGAGSTVPHPLHNGGTPFDPTQCYLVRDGHMHNSMCVVSYALNDVPPGSGGFCCIPGSHKSSFPIPPQIAEIVDDTPPVVHVQAQAGDAIIFTEAVTHGAIPWRGETPRRSILFKFCQGHVQWERDSPLANSALDWTEHAQRILTHPYAGHRPPTIGASRLAGVS
jgi:Phytanoyl-CoA dioxygenase (PhyH)